MSIWCLVEGEISTSSESGLSIKKVFIPEPYCEVMGLFTVQIVVPFYPRELTHLLQRKEKIIQAYPTFYSRVEGGQVFTVMIKG